MTRRDPLEERAAEAVWTALEEGRLADGVGLEVDGDTSGGAELRLHAELLGLLPLELEERPPAAAARERLLAKIRSAGTAAAEIASPQVASPQVASLSAARRRRDDTAAARAAAPRAASGIPVWMGVLAASLLAAVLGLTAYSSFLYGRLQEQKGRLADQQTTIARLSSDLDSSRQQVDMLAAARTDLQNQLSLVSSPDVEVCPLKPTRDPMFPAARGLLFLSEPRNAWYVRVADVEPPPPGKIYRLWFVLGNKAQPAGILMPAGDGVQEMGGSGLPARGEMTAAAVTLEPMEHSAEQPNGPMVLFGDQRFGMI